MNVVGDKVGSPGRGVGRRVVGATVEGAAEGVVTVSVGTAVVTAGTCTVAPV